jgi:hypothetical protein
LNDKARCPGRIRRIPFQLRHRHPQGSSPTPTNSVLLLDGGDLHRMRWRCGVGSRQRRHPQSGRCCTWVLLPVTAEGGQVTIWLRTPAIVLRRLTVSHHPGSGAGFSDHAQVHCVRPGTRRRRPLLRGLVKLTCNTVERTRSISQDQSAAFRTSSRVNTARHQTRPSPASTGHHTMKRARRPHRVFLHPRLIRPPDARAVPG